MKYSLKSIGGNLKSFSLSAEALRVIRQLEKYVDSKYQTKEDFNLTTGKVAGTGFKEINVAPIRADYYAKGKTNNVPNWKHYF